MIPSLIRKFHKVILSRNLWDIIKFLIILGIIYWIISTGSDKLNYNWQWYRVKQFLYTFDQGSFTVGPLLQGLWVTLKITFFSLFLALALGLTTSIFRLSNSMVAGLVARTYVEVIRNTPLLIQLLFNYFVLSPILGISPFMTAVLTLSLFEGAYASEIIRAGIQSIDKGQWEAAQSSGLNRMQTYFYIIIPQAYRFLVPPLTNQSVSLVKDSALVSTIAIYDLTMQGQVIISNTFLTFEIWFTVAAIYLAVALIITLVVSILEKRLQGKKVPVKTF
ncbi:amino acid ABC transporter permease [Desulfonatronovibrio hydrogenovorans]|uniref:amino acid ABC transporter permease n=1 Tax=Desulfonatronovibrio hydrogenovorans TaxID=53245 RepID=UPI00055939B7|nr:amino acid ABC transporter permease [Desulfonatronovibrio hydrogenovorans]